MKNSKNKVVYDTISSKLGKIYKTYKKFVRKGNREKEYNPNPFILKSIKEEFSSEESGGYGKYNPIPLKMVFNPRDFEYGYYHGFSIDPHMNPREFIDTELFYRMKEYLFVNSKFPKEDVFYSEKLEIKFGKFNNSELCFLEVDGLSECQLFERSR